MRHLRIKEHSVRLSELKTKDPGVEKAVVFVEKLYGRTLRSDPNVLIITEENKPKVLDALRSDLPNSVVVHSPFLFLLSRKRAREVSEELKKSLLKDYPNVDPSRIDFAEFSWSEISSPEQLLLKIAHTWGDIWLRTQIESVAWVDDQDFLKRMRGLAKTIVLGLHIGDSGLIVLNSKGTPGILVHELVHAEDTAIFGRIKPGFGTMVAEGRAKFGETLFEDSEDGSSKHMDDLRNSSFYNWIKTLATEPEKTLHFFKKKGPKESVRFMKTLYDVTIGVTGFGFQRVYMPFAMELIELTSALRDPYLAFQVATAKPPTKLVHLYHSLDYYSDEVSRFRKSDQ